jgi:hypothetical protein
MPIEFAEPNPKHSVLNSFLRFAIICKHVGCNFIAGSTAAVDSESVREKAFGTTQQLKERPIILHSTS